MSNIALFEEKHVRREWHEEKWVFSIIDVVGILTDSDRPRKYWADLKKKLIQEGYIEVSEKIGHLKMLASDGKMRETDVADTETLLRIVQSIPSPKAEPFKRWLARVGVERLQEIENPELAMARTRAIYQAKGYSDAWIERRLRGMAVRDELTNEWKERGVKESTEYAILTAEISRATFGLTPKQYRTVLILAAIINNGARTPEKVTSGSPRSKTATLVCSSPRYSAYRNCPQHTAIIHSND